MPSQIEIEARDAIKTLNKLLKDFELKERRKILRKAARPMVEAARANAPVSSAVHFRYSSTDKASGRIRAPKGKGKIVAKYVPGNLKNSIRTLTFRRDRSAVYVGPKIAKRQTGFKTYGSNKTTVDAYYAHMVEYGTRHYPARGYMRKAYGQAKQQVLRKVEDLARAKVKKFGNRNRA